MKFGRDNLPPFPFDAEWMSARFSGRHAAAAAVAWFLSLIAHALLLYFLSRLAITFPALMQFATRPSSSESERVIRVERPTVLPEEAAAAGQKEPDRTGTASAGPGQPAPAARRAEDAEQLRQLPPASTLQPPAVNEDRLQGATRNLTEPAGLPDRKPWEPRQEILSIENRIVADKEAALPRKIIPRIERIAQAPDIVESAGRDDLLAGAGLTNAAGTAPGGRGPAPAGRTPTGGGAAAQSPVRVDEPRSPTGRDMFEERASEVAPARPIEKLLKTKLVTYTTAKDPGYGYFRLEIQRAGEEVLPVIPKDVVLVQDSSASMSDLRLHFCQDGLKRCLRALGPRDRFNVATFRERSETCFPDWAENNAENVRRAEGFIDRIAAGGNTDIYASLSKLVELSAKSGRPVIVLVVSDGFATTGLVESSDVIGQFTKLNDGRLSVFSLGTMRSANSYLLDLLTYCNRGDSSIAAGGRWGIPESMEQLAKQIGRPVLTAVGFRFAATSGCEVYPVQASNLYLDRPLVLYGRYPRNLERILFQAVGQAGDKACDMIFDLPLRGASAGDEELRTDWATQKIYYLIGRYARQPLASTMEDLDATAKSYRLRIPYRGKF
jgi:hypothetical protein